MAKFSKLAGGFLKREEGPTVTEYAIMLALIVVLAFAAISGIGSKLDNTVTTLDTKVTANSGL